MKLPSALPDVALNLDWTKYILTLVRRIDAKGLPVILVLLLALPVLAQLQAGPDNSPKVGEMAPDFPIPAAQRGQPAGSSEGLPGQEECAADVLPGCVHARLHDGIH